MFVTALELADFRSYEHVDLELGAGVTVFVGNNGQGKTNLVEAVDYLATLRSHRVASEVPLVRAGAERAVVRARVQAGLDDDRQLLLEVEITPGRANRARLNRGPLPRARDLLGVLRSVVFSPEDLAIVKGDPEQRRRFLDELVVARWPRMAGVRADYERVLKQRNALLRTMAGRRRGAPPEGSDEATLAVWDEQLARFGAEVLAARLDTLAELEPHVAEAYAGIAPTNNVATVGYRSSTDLAGATDPEGLAESLLAGIEDRRRDETARGVSLVGPHRDDLVLGLGELPARGYASHGESWSFALALRLGSFALLRADGIEPVLILDDVFAELDATRRLRLAERAIEAEQLLVTAAVEEDLPGEWAEDLPDGDDPGGDRGAETGDDEAAAPEPGGPDVAHHDDTGLDLATMVARAARGRRPGAPAHRRRRRPDAPQFSGARDDGRDPQPLSRALGRLADERGWNQTVSVHLLLGRWPALVGATVAAHSTPESYRDGLLVVRASSTAWASQLRLMAPNLLAAINAEVGQGSVERIQVLGPDAPSWKHGIRSVSDGRGPRDTYG